MKAVAKAEGVGFVDLFGPSQALYAKNEQPLTMNGVHLLEHGNRTLARVIDRELFGVRDSADEKQLERLREAILDRQIRSKQRTDARDAPR